MVGGGGGWPLFRQLLAFAPPAQTAALVTSIGKRLHAALDAAVAALAPPASANTPAGGSSSSGISGSSSTSGGGAAGGGGGMTRAAAVRHLAQCTSLITSVLPAAAFRTDGGGLAAQRRVWLLVWHAIHRWLPPLARCIRLLQLLDSSDDSGSSSGGGGSSGGGSNGGGSGGGGGGGSSRGSQELLLLCDCYTRYVLEPVAALADRAADAAGENSSSSSSGGGGSSQAVAAAVADAVAGSWRQWLLHEADVLGVCEVAIERLAVKPAGGVHTVRIPALADVRRPTNCCTVTQPHTVHDHASSAASLFLFPSRSLILRSLHASTSVAATHAALTQFLNHAAPVLTNTVCCLPVAPVL